MGMTGLALLVVGCSTLQPTRGVVPAQGTVTAFDITDAGRIALGGSMGPEIAQIEGRLLSRDSSEYVLGVTAVRLLRGGEQVWHGEPVHIKTEYVSSIYERRRSTARSVAMGAVGVGAIAIIVTRSLLGSGVSDPGRPPGDTATTQRVPRP
jgi:hypothetical protein